MLAEDKIREALAHKADEVVLPADLLEHIRRENGELLLLSRWERFWRAVRRRVEVTAVAAILLMLLGFAMFVRAELHVATGEGSGTEAPAPGEEAPAKVPIPLVRLETLLDRWERRGWETQVNPQAAPEGVKRAWSIAVLGKTVQLYEYSSFAEAEQAYRLLESDLQESFVRMPGALLELPDSDLIWREPLLASLGYKVPLPSDQPVISEHLALREAQGIADLNWSASLYEVNWMSVYGTWLEGPVWIVEAKDEKGVWTVLYLSGYTGQVLQRLDVAPLEYPAADSEIELIERYFTAMQEGRYTDVFQLYHPSARNKTKTMSDGFVLAHSINRSALSLKDRPDFSALRFRDNGVWIDPACDCSAGTIVEVRVESQYSSSGLLDLLRDHDGKFWLLWR